MPKGAASDVEIARLRARIEALLGAAHSQRGYWGVLIANRDTGETLYSLNPDHFFTPASNAKIFTTSLALATLGPDYRFRTTLESQGVLGTDGRLAGDLVLVGRGDPDLSNRRFPYDKKVEFDGPVDKVLAEMADAAVAKGLKEVDGDVVADDSYFPYDPYPAGWNVGDLFFRFGAPVSAIAFNDNTASVYMRPGASATDAPSITVDPAGATDTFGVELADGCVERQIGIRGGAAAWDEFFAAAGIDFAGTCGDAHRHRHARSGENGGGGIEIAAGSARRPRDGRSARAAWRATGNHSERRAGAGPY